MPEGAATPGEPFRLDIAFHDDGSSVTQLCAVGERPAACATGALPRFDKLHANAKRLYPEVARWIATPARDARLYGMTYGEFLRKLVAYQGGYPLPKADRTATVRLRLVPDPNGVGRGSVAFSEPVDPDLLRCFHCTDLKCMNNGVRYRFDDRFVSMTRVVPEAGPTGASWIITGPTPLGDGDAQWKFACGVSRYSLQTLTY